jgi:hypothetical protein
MWSCPGNMPKYFPGLRDILPFGRVICLSDLGNILAYHLDKTTLLYNYTTLYLMCSQAINQNIFPKVLGTAQCSIAQSRWSCSHYRGKNHVGLLPDYTLNINYLILTVWYTNMRSGRTSQLLLSSETQKSESPVHFHTS